MWTVVPSTLQWVAPDPCAYGKTTGDQWDINNKQNKIKLEEDHVSIYTQGVIREMEKMGQTCSNTLYYVTFSKNK